MAAQNLTQNQLKEILHYDPETGIFTWLVTLNSRAITGREAGHVGHTGYIRIRYKGVEYLGHRLAWLYVHGEWPPNHLDHINHIRSDNRIANLRESSYAKNAKNQSKSSRNKSGVVGVSWYKRDSKWIALISNRGKLVNLGKFDRFEDAVKARKAAEERFGYHPNHGKAKPNIEPLDIPLSQSAA